MSISIRTACLAGAFVLIGKTAFAAPVTLADALARGAQNSPRIAQARAQAYAAEARARQAGVGPNPEIGVVVENFAGSGPFHNFRSSETTLQLSQRFELGGKRSARVAVARAERDFAALGFRRAQADVARDIRIAHAELRAAEELVGLARDNVARTQELSRTAGLLVEQGRDPPLRKLRADALVAEARAESARSVGMFLSARRALATLIASDDPELIAGNSSSLTRPAELPKGTAGLDERLGETERDAAQARIALAKSSAVPDVTASGGFRRFGDGGDTAFIAGFSIPLPVRDRNRGGIEAARSDSIASEASLAQIRLDASRARRDAALAVDAAEARVAALNGAGSAEAEEALRLAMIGYAAGKFSLVELIDTQTAYSNAKLALIQAQLDLAKALADLARANAQ